VIKKLLHHHVSLGVLEDDSDITSRLIRLAQLIHSAFFCLLLQNVTVSSTVT